MFCALGSATKIDLPRNAEGIMPSGATSEFKSSQGPKVTAKPLVSTYLNRAGDGGSSVGASVASETKPVSAKPSVAANSTALSSADAYRDFRVSVGLRV